jgi:alpha-maltose-1-phosphate synthase
VREPFATDSIPRGASRLAEDDTSQHSVVVANPGAVAELPSMAAGVAGAGLLRAYVAPFGSRRQFALLPGYILRGIEPELRRRRVQQPAIIDAQVRHVATVLEALVVVSQRAKVPRSGQNALIRVRNAFFDRRVAQMLRGTDRAFIGCYTAAERSFRACQRLGIVRFLEYPIAHHAFAQRVLTEEAALRPEYALTLQSHRFPPWLKDQLDLEVGLADKIFVLSTFHKRTFLESGIDERKLVVTPLGVDLEQFKPRQRDPADRPFRIVFVGQITQRKGISYLIDAFKKAAIPRAELVFVGRICGDHRVWSREPGVSWMPHIPRSELPALYASASAFVLPSIVEGFALTALEAMACGIPVIVSTNTFATDVITDGRDGFVVPIRNADAIAERLVYLNDHLSERNQIGKAARARAEQFSWEVYGQRVARALSSSVASSATGGMRPPIGQGAVVHDGRSLQE